MTGLVVRTLAKVSTSIGSLPSIENATIECLGALKPYTSIPVPSKSIV